MIKPLIVILSLLVLDFSGSKIAEQIAEANLPTKIEENINWKTSGVQSCTRKRALILYSYQVCYDVIAWGENREDWSASAYYHKPRSLFHYSRLFMSTDYYFHELAYGEILTTKKYNLEN